MSQKPRTALIQGCIETTTATLTFLLGSVHRLVCLNEHRCPFAVDCHSGDVVEDVALLCQVSVAPDFQMGLALQPWGHLEKKPKRVRIKGKKRQEGPPFSNKVPALHAEGSLVQSLAASLSRGRKDPSQSKILDCY